MRPFIFSLFVVICLQVSCSIGNTPNEDVRNVTFTYDALCAMQPRDIPTYVYVFPPLRSSKGGKPIEKLTAVTSDTGEVTGWKTSSALSMSMKPQIEAALTTAGYEVVSFADLLSVRRPYSVLVVSTFYTLPYDVKNEAGEITDKATLVLIKGALFDGNLDPKTKKDIIKVDGVSKVPVGKDFPDPVSRTLERAFSWFADNSSGRSLMDL